GRTPSGCAMPCSSKTGSKSRCTRATIASGCGSARRSITSGPISNGWVTPSRAGSRADGGMLTGMRHVRLVLPIAVAVAAATLAAQRAPETAIPSTFFDGAQLLRDLKTLSADDMEGRQVGTAGGEKARAYVLARFKAAGLAPFNGSCTTSFTFTPGARGTPPPVERTGMNVIGRIDGRVP